MARCDRCQMEVIWARTGARGTSIPLDYREVLDGDMFALVDGDIAVCVPEVQRFEVRQSGRRLYAPHRRWCSPERRTG